MRSVDQPAEILWGPTDAQRREATRPRSWPGPGPSPGDRSTNTRPPGSGRWTNRRRLAAVADFFTIPFTTPPTRVLADASMPGARWFEGATLNYAEAVFARATSQHPALLAISEREPLREITWIDLREQVAAAAELRPTSERRRPFGPQLR